MKKIVAILTLFASFMASAADFDAVFNDSTLRVDYLFSADSLRSRVYTSGMTLTPGWHGRRTDLKNLVFAGDGQIHVINAASRDTVYSYPFSTLFSEWLATPEAQTGNGAYEVSLLVPQPREESIIAVDLNDKRHEVIAHSTTVYRPDDILVRRPDVSSPRYETRYLHRATADGPAIDIAILAEGYTPGEMESFFERAQMTADEILRYKPFDEYADRFNFIAVATPSRDSGVSIPREGKWLDTAFDSHFSTFYSDRYLTTPSVSKLHEALLGVPYESIIVLANTDEYGGGGIFNSYLLTADKHPAFLPVVVHEFGHSFAALGDEYAYAGNEDATYPLDIEPWEPNITTLVDFDSKWKGMLPQGTPVPTPADKAKDYPVGAYEGGGYKLNGVYRPADECRMRNNTYPTFCPVCEASIKRLIESLLH